MTTRVPVNPEVLRHYIERSRVAPEELDVSDLDKILVGQKQPTFAQLSNIARKTNTPTGLLVLPEVVDIGKTRLQFRTIGSQPVRAMSAELRDTIAEMQSKQDFLRDELDEDVGFVGRYAHERDIRVIAQGIREYLELPCPLEGNNPQDVLNRVRQAASRIGVYIFFNGKIKDNTHRPLSLDEFRGFVLTDSKAPLIFINGRDSKRGQLFTLIHELVHLFIGSEEIMEDIDHRTPEEAFVNAITGEILMPRDRVLHAVLGDVPELAARYKVSEEVAVRRLYDVRRISHQQYDDYVADLESRYHSSEQDEDSDSTSHAYYKTALPYRIDARFFRTVQNAVDANRITPTEALNLVGVGYKGYRLLSKKDKL